MFNKPLQQHSFLISYKLLLNMQRVERILTRFRQQLIQIMNLQGQDKSYKTASSFMDKLISLCCCRKCSVNEKIHLPFSPALQSPLSTIQLLLCREIDRHLFKLINCFWVLLIGLKNQRSLWKTCFVLPTEM